MFNPFISITNTVPKQNLVTYPVTGNVQLNCRFCNFSYIVVSLFHSQTCKT